MDTETGVLFHIPSVCDSSYFSSTDILSRNLGMNNAQGYLHNVDLIASVMTLLAGNYLSPGEERQCHVMILYLYRTWDDRCLDL
jgi:hypothetical protein